MQKEALPNGEVLETRVEIHSHGPGDWGPSGAVPDVQLKKGEAGPPGAATWYLTTGYGPPTSYAQRFDASLSTMRFSGSNGMFDDAAECGDTVEASITFANTHDMPTPDNALLEVRLFGPDAPSENEPSSRTTVPPNFTGSTTLPPLTFVTPGHRPQRGAAQDVNFRVHADVYSLRFQANLIAKSVADQCTTRCPVIIASVTGRHAVVAGGLVPVSWVIRSVAKRPLGKNEPSKRHVETQLRQPRQNAHDVLLFRSTPDSQPVSLEKAFSQNIASLQPGAEVTVSGYLQFGPDARLDTRLTLDCALLLGGIGSPTTPTDVHVHEHELQLTRGFVLNPDEDFIFITNHRSQLEFVKVWIAELHAKNSEYNMSLYNKSDFLRVDLSQALEGRTVIMGDNVFKEVDSEANTFLRNFLPANALFQTGAQIGQGKFSTIIVTDSNAAHRAPLLVEKLLAPDSDVEPQVHISLDAFMRTYEGNACAVLEAPGGADIIMVPAPSCFFGCKGLADVEAELRSFLRRHDPQTYYAITREVDHDSGNMGRLTVQRGLDLNSRNATQIRVSADENPRLTLKTMRYSLCKGMTFANKLKYLSRVAENSESDICKALRRAVISDLAEEQRLLRQSEFRRALDGPALDARLVNLRQFANFEFATPLPGSQPWQSLTDMLARIHLMLNDSLTAMDRLPLLHRRRRDLQRVGNAIVEQMVQRLFLGNVDSARQAIAYRQTQQADLLRLRDDERQHLLKHLRPMGHSSHMVTDFAVLARLG